MKHITFFLVLILCCSSVFAMRRPERSDAVDQSGESSGRGYSKRVRIIGDQPQSMAVVEQFTAGDYETQWRSWTKCAKGFDVMGLHMNGYISFVCKDLMKGVPVTEELKRLHNNPDKVSPAAQAYRARLASNYKIHLMPFDEDIVPIMTVLLQRLKQDASLQQAIGHFKICAETDQIMRAQDYYMPLFVIYLHADKHAAQYALNSVYALLKDTRGRDVTPRFNQKITSLIYCAQGDGDYKSDVFAQYYDQDRVYYRPDFEGGMKDYRLQHPGNQ